MPVNMPRGLGLKLIIIKIINSYIVHTCITAEVPVHFITPAHQAHKSFLKPSHLPGGVYSSIAANLAKRFAAVETF